MTTAGARTNGTRASHGGRVAVKNEGSPFLGGGGGGGSATPNGSKDETASRSRSPDDDVKPSPSDISTPDTSAAAPRPNRKSSAKASRSATPSSRPNRTLFDQLPNATAEATSQFQVIADCLYGSKNMGSSDHDAFDCDCAEEIRDGRNMSCGEDSDCINRATKMECVEGGCNCGEHCQNQRFQQRQYASVSVIKTEKKGFGLRADADLHQNEFIFEYIGEVINEPTFRRRMIQYDEEGIKHFYFMSLTKSEFVDATRKGNLGRFCNHSCNPNCYVDKWVVGNKLRMGIFAGRSIRAGEELVFDYNVDRYGADPQPCYCGEPNCTGFIGGKTQTERATKLSLATIEALGIDDPDSWDTTVSKKQRRKKPNEDEEEYISGLQQSGLTEDGVTKVMATLMQCKEKWIAVKLLARIQAARDDERVLHRVVRMHGYQILCSILTLFKDDNNVVLQVLDILYMFPRLTKNKISDSNIELAIKDLTTSEHEDVAAESKRLLEEWDKLQTAYRIPRKKFDPNAPASAFEDRRGRDVQTNESIDGTSTPRQRAISPLHGLNVPKGPRSNIPQRNSNFFNGGANNPNNINNGTPRNQRKQMNNINNSNQNATQSLPSGWYSATDPKGNVYYYNKSGATTWKKPTATAENVKGPSKAQQDMDAVQEIINRITKEAPARPSVTHTPQAAKTPVQEPKSERWRSLPVEKQQKIYENTLHPHIKSVTDRYRNKLPREEIKRLGKDISKKIVASDYKNNRVDDPNAITPMLVKKMKVYVHDYFERAVKKFQEHEKKKAGKAGRDGKDAAVSSSSASGTNAGSKDVEMTGTAGSSAAVATIASKDDDLAAMDDMALSDDGDKAASTVSPETSDRKRKRADSGIGGGDASKRGNGAAASTAFGGVDSPSLTPSETPLIKRLKDEGVVAAGTLTPPTPPPPPPPPAEEEDASRAAARRQREEEEEALRRENEDAMRDFEEQSKQNGPSSGQAQPVAVSGTAGQ
ncbi:histone methyltransferase set2 [Sporothrix stenoceras]|uniref:Histone-lysine N-methyltransferase, H3 lysine-36 specific n=1 Tax=Sporothrix stenoceras TaxID=5173 RepID=A0ABR3Z2D6_9PEZI